MDQAIQIISASALGLALAAACGLRVFLPLFVMAISTKLGWIQTAAGFEWIGSWSAIVALTTACGLEIAGYYLPAIDNALDAIASPAAVIAGTLTVAAATFGAGGEDALPDIVRWSIAAIGGGGLAATVQAGTVATRAISTTTTAGVANPVVSTVENVAAFVMSVLAIVVPVVAALVVLTAIVLVARVIVRKVRRKRSIKNVVQSPKVLRSSSSMRALSEATSASSASSRVLSPVPVEEAELIGAGA